MGFSRFPPPRWRRRRIAAAAAGTCLVFISFLLESFPMSSPSKDLKETESALRSVIQVLIDAQDGFKKFGEQSKRNPERIFPCRISHPRAIPRSAGIHPSPGRRARRQRERNRRREPFAAPGATSNQLLAQAIKACSPPPKKAKTRPSKPTPRPWRPTFPLPVRQVLATQAAHIEKSRDFIKTAREAGK